MIMMYASRGFNYLMPMGHCSRRIRAEDIRRARLSACWVYSGMFGRLRILRFPALSHVWFCVYWQICVGKTCDRQGFPASRLYTNL
jgi:hypothetical protein